MDFSKPAAELERLVRGLNPWPSAYTFVNGKTLKVWKSVLGQETSDAEPGTVMGTDAQGIHVACKDGSAYSYRSAAGRKETNGSRGFPAGISYGSKEHVLQIIMSD